MIGYVVVHSCSISFSELPDDAETTKFQMADFITFSARIIVIF